MAYPKGKPRPPKAGRKKGSLNKVSPILLDALSVLRTAGYDPLARHVEMHQHAWAAYMERFNKKASWGANGALEAAIRTNEHILKYCYPTFKSVDHTVTGGIAIGSYTDIAKALGAEIDEELKQKELIDVTRTVGEKKD